jgi:6-phosphogluconolactonase (cycloisomerase 2 family)
MGTEPDPDLSTVATTSAPAGARAFVVVRATGQTGQGSVQSYDIDPGTGGFRRIASLALFDPDALAVHPGGRFLYVADRAPENSYRTAVSVLAISDSGELTPRGQFVPTGPGPHTMMNTIRNLAATRDVLFARFVGASTGNHGGIVAFGIDGETGALRYLGNVLPQLFEPAFVAPDPAGRFFYTEEGSALVAVDVASFVARDTHTVDGYVAHAMVAPSGRWLFWVDGRAVAVNPLDPATGGLGTATRLPLGATAEPGGLAVDPASRRVYVAFDSGEIQSFAFDATAVRLAAGGAVAGPQRAGIMAVSPDGRFLYVVDLESGRVLAYAVEPDTGTLALLGYVAEAAGALAVGPLPSAR